MPARRWILVALASMTGAVGCWRTRALEPGATEESRDSTQRDTADSELGQTDDTDTGDTLDTAEPGETGNFLDTANSGGTETVTPPDTDGRDTAVSDMLLPIAVGNLWTYGVETFVEHPLCASGLYASEITGTVEVDGDETFLIRSFCDFEGWGQNTSYLRIDEDGQSVDRYYGGNWFNLISTPVEEGRAFSCEHDECMWENAGTVDTPAGTFDDCWARVPLSGDSDAYTDTYCRGVGLVTSTIAGNYTAVLVEYDLR